MRRERPTLTSAARPLGAPPEPGRTGAAAVQPSWLVTGLVAALAGLAYANTLGHQFTLDDLLIITENASIRDLRNVPGLFLTHYWAGQPQSPSQGLYRPLTVSTYALNYAMRGLNPTGYHVVNVLLHALATALLFRLLARLFGPGFAPAAAAVLFAVHPIHTEAVANIAGRAELLAFVGIMMCCNAYERARLADAAGRTRTCTAWIAVCVAGYLIGAFSKEIGAVAPAAVLLTEALLPHRRWLFGRRRAGLLAFGSLIAAAGAYLALRAVATSGDESAGLWRAATTPERIATAVRISGEYVGLLAFPRTLVAEYAPADTPIARSFAEPGVLLGSVILGVLLAGAIVAWRRLPLLAWGVGFAAITFLPASNLLLPIGIVKAERILYSPSAGFVCVVAALLGQLATRARLRPVAGIALTAITLALGGRTWARNADWRDPDTLCDATLAASPQSPIFNTHLATRLAGQGRRQEARERFEFVLSIAPRSFNAVFRLGRLELEEHNYARAIEWLERAAGLRPDAADVQEQLGKAYAAVGDHERAAACFDRVRVLAPGDPGGYLLLVRAQLNRKQPEAALPVITEALRRFPNHALTHLFAGWVYSELGRADEAAAENRRALELDPGLARQRPQP
jgi:tetratricopeptide (TPR) repeat protein